MKNNIIFAGCSFTWGQGLWFYLDTPEHVPSFEEWIFQNKPLPSGSHEIREKLRFPKLVSDKLNFNIISKQINGGTDEESVQFINYIFDKSNHIKSEFSTKKYNYNEIDLCVYQTTQLHRNGFRFVYNNEIYYVKSTPDNRAFDFLEKIIINEDGHEKNIPQKNFNILFEYMYHNDLDVEDIINSILTTTVDKIENTLKKLHQNSIKILLFCWTDEFLKEIQKREFFNNKLIPIRYKNENFLCLDYLFRKYPHMMIVNDKTVLHNSGYDKHPSKECHEIIAKSILEKYYNE